MIRTRLPHIFAAAAAIALLTAWQPVGEPVTLKAESRLWFDGESTVRDWSCAAKEMDAAIDGEANAATEVLSGRRAVRTVNLTIRTARLDCDNRTMNNHMLKALNAQEHTTITFALVSYDVVRAATVTGTLQGTLTINGQTRPVVLPVVFARADDALRVTGTYPLNMTEWRVVPPKLMLGTMKVKPVVIVQFDLLLQS